ncbi:unnamed protein product [Prorocentrum cordatum]|uniref:DNA helicase n=1 Tax=Prorocentrum cordatum TaxID=2364126 RepID=A0ABN9V9V1_9DINO|nr:unnamed protein product [Polarella glacialis]
MADLQMVGQFSTLSDLGRMLREKLISADAFKEFVSYSRCASYPSVEQFEAEREDVEAAWPAFAGDMALSRLPAFFWKARGADAGAAEWADEYEKRLQHCLSRMNHHVHPKCERTGERRPLRSCMPKGKSGCKADFPLENQMCRQPVLVCRCVAVSRCMPMTGPRSALGTVLSARNSEWLNAGPRALIAFAGSNADVKFPHRLPILPESHEVLVFDARRHTCYGGGDLAAQANDLQAAMALAAGYFGGYSSKMQDIGQKEIQRLSATLERKVASDGARSTNRTAAQEFQHYSRRLVRDLECKGIVRTSLESCLLSLHADHPDALMAECIRTFPTVRFPAVDLLKREEIETGKVVGRAVASGMRPGGGKLNFMYTEAPFALMYGFRGTSHNVDVLSPYEMLLHWSMEKIHPPLGQQEVYRAVMTDAGRRFAKECRDGGIRCNYKSGDHFVAVEAPGRILLPDVPELRGLRHAWCWERRHRLHLPTWTFAPTPGTSLSQEENARRLSVYMRPWCLTEVDAKWWNPILSDLGKCIAVDGEDVPAWLDMLNRQGSTEAAETPRGECTGSDVAVKRRRFTTKGPPAEVVESETYYSYRSSWEKYLDGYVVSKTSQRYIVNLLAAACTVAREEHIDSSDGSSEESWKNEDTRAGSMDVVHKALNGMARLDATEQSTGFGRHADIINMGRALWQTPPLGERVAQRIVEVEFDSRGYPASEELRKAFAKKKSMVEDRPAPYRGVTMPFASLSVVDYGRRMDEWLAQLQREGMAPEPEDVAVIEEVMRRVRVEFELEKEGCELPKGHADREVGMVADTLLGALDKHLSDAAQVNRYRRRSDKTYRPFGGYNVLAFGDFYQIPPIPASAAVFLPPKDGKTSQEKAALELFWSSDPRVGLTHFWELVIQKRVTADPWYNSVLQEAREGRMSEESYHFLMGMPTAHAGCWPFAAGCTCQEGRCKTLDAVWADMKLRGATWQAMRELECAECQSERERRNRLVLPEDQRVVQEPFVSAPYMHKNNDPKYHAMLLRAAEFAKAHELHTLWFTAQDKPDNPAQIAKTPGKLKQGLEKLLMLHDQKTAGIPGVNILYVGMKGRTTEKVCKAKDIVILKHMSCELVGWELHPADRVRVAGSERFLNYLPRCLYLRVDGATWNVDPKLAGACGNSASGAKIRRTGFTWIPDFASTAFMMQGATLTAGLADCGDVLDLVGSSEAMTAYVILSRLTSAEGLLLLRAFAPELFRQGAAAGPHCLLKLLRARHGPDAATAGGPAGEAQEYGRAEATEEYATMVAAQEAGRERRKQRGPTWACWCCRLAFPAEGFGAKPRHRGDVGEKCLGSGHWRECKACADALCSERAKDAAATFLQKQCISCQHLQIIALFEEGSDECNACVLAGSYEVYVCAKCGEYVSGVHAFRMPGAEVAHCCSKCCKDQCVFECTVCGTEKPVISFRGQPRQVRRQAIRRCAECEVCVVCKERVEDYRKFVCNGRVCAMCAPVKCEVCERTLAKDSFPRCGRTQQRGAERHVRRCLECHECPECRQVLDKQCFSKAEKVCRECSARLTCEVCERMLPKDSFPNGGRQRQRGDERPVRRCLECHKCSECKQVLDRKCFTKAEKACMQCGAAAEKCEVCERMLPKDSFPDGGRQRQRGAERPVRRCLECHKCSECEQVLDRQCFTKAEKACIQCGAAAKKCEVCERMLPKVSFPDGGRQRQRGAERPVRRCLECHKCSECEQVLDRQCFTKAEKACRLRGALATCPSCGATKSPTEFDAEVLRHARRHGRGAVRRACKSSTGPAARKKVKAM